jgi:hypothetical protein
MLFNCVNFWRFRLGLSSCGVVNLFLSCSGKDHGRSAVTSVYS